MPPPFQFYIIVNILFIFCQSLYYLLAISYDGFSAGTFGEDTNKSARGSFLIRADGVGTQIIASVTGIFSFIPDNTSSGMVQWNGAGERLTRVELNLPGSHEVTPASLTVNYYIAY